MALSFWIPYAETFYNTRKFNNIDDGIKQVNKMYLQHGLNITCIHADSEF